MLNNKKLTGSNQPSNLMLMNDENSIYGISYNCPVLKREQYCPLLKIDSLPFNKKIDWINSLSREEKLIVLKHHFACSRKRENIGLNWYYPLEAI